jgi:hypothetical protein
MTWKLALEETRKRTEHKKQKETTREGDKEGERGRYRMGKVYKYSGSTLKLFTVPTEHIYTVFCTCILRVFG